ncbi:hypothetical protein HDU96_002384, partial [Phlyctochytrium bullatum]
MSFPPPGPGTTYGAPPVINPGRAAGGPFPVAAMAAPVIHATPIISTTNSNVMNETVYVPSPMDKLTTVFVGSITEGVYDSWMERILRTCGVVRNWKRVTDSNARPKGFGFCIYDNAESVWRALKVLGGEGLNRPGLELPSLDADFPSKRLMLKVDAVARRHVDEYKAAVARTGSEEMVAKGDKAAEEELAVVMKDMKSI